MSTQLSNSGGGAYDPRYFSKSTQVDWWEGTKRSRAGFKY